MFILLNVRETVTIIFENCHFLVFYWHIGIYTQSNLRM